MKNKTFNTDFKPDIEFARFVRKKRSEIKAELKSGRLTLKELISNKEKYEKYIINLKVLELICSMPGFGDVRAEKALMELHINICKRMGGLGKKQKERLFRYFNIQDMVDK